MISWISTVPALPAKSPARAVAAVSQSQPDGWEPNTTKPRAEGLQSERFLPRRERLEAGTGGSGSDESAGRARGDADAAPTASRASAEIVKLGIAQQRGEAETPEPEPVEARALNGYRMAMIASMADPAAAFLDKAA